jgi:hypothetical protein
MSPTTWAATFGSFCFLAAVALAVWALCVRAMEVRDEDDHYARLAPEPVDRALWEPTAPLWPNSSTPIFDQLAAEHLRADLDDDDARLRAWMGGAS